MKGIYGVWGNSDMNFETQANRLSVTHDPFVKSIQWGMATVLPKKQPAPCAI